MKLYYTYLLVADILILATIVLPLVVAALVFLQLLEALAVTTSVVLPFVFAVSFIALWIPKFFASVNYLFTEAEIVVERGVWWKHKSTVPYNRVTNIDVVQGPISRRFGLAKVRVQTAGYSATGGGAAIAQAQIFGVTDYEEIRGFVLNQVRGLKPVAVEAAAEAAGPREASQQMLTELRRIRELLERQENRE